MSINLKIINILKDQNAPISKKHLKILARCRNQSLVKSIKELLTESRIGRNGSGKKNSPYLYYIKSVDLGEDSK